MAKGETSSRTEDLVARLVELAEEQLRWQRAAVTPSVRATIERALATKQQREAFERCDGQQQSMDIAQAVGTSKQNFSGWTRRWRDLGIAYEVDGRKVKHLASLRSLGIPLDPSADGARGRGPMAE
jgi:hypothetical protein